MQYIKVLIFSILLFFLLTFVSALVTYFHFQYNSDVTDEFLLTIDFLSGLVCLVSFAIWVINIKEKPLLSALIVSLLVVFFDILSVSLYMGHVFLGLGKVIDFLILYFSLLLGAGIGIVINKRNKRGLRD